jgi:hypothetical protein
MSARNGPRHPDALRGRHGGDGPAADGWLIHADDARGAERVDGVDPAAAPVTRRRTNSGLLVPTSPPPRPTSSADGECSTRPAAGRSVPVLKPESGPFVRQEEEYSRRRAISRPPAPARGCSPLRLPIAFRSQAPSPTRDVRKAGEKTVAFVAGLVTARPTPGGATLRPANVLHRRAACEIHPRALLIGADTGACAASSPPRAGARASSAASLDARGVDCPPATSFHALGAGLDEAAAVIERLARVGPAMPQTDLYRPRRANTGAPRHREATAPRAAARRPVPPSPRRPAAPTASSGAPAHRGSEAVSRPSIRHRRRRRGPARAGRTRAPASSSAASVAPYVKQRRRDAAQGRSGRDTEAGALVDANVLRVLTGNARGHCPIMCRKQGGRWAGNRKTDLLLRGGPAGRARGPGGGGRRLATSREWGVGWSLLGGREPCARGPARETSA